MIIDYEIVDEANDEAWNEWAHLIRTEKWTSDNSVLGLTPTLRSTKIVLARRKNDGGFVGCVVWNENDGIAFIGFYILKPEYRELGIGSKMWRRAMERMPKSHIIGLKASGAKMIEKYRANDTPIEGPTMTRWKLTCEQLNQACKGMAPNADLEIKLVSSLTTEEFQKLLDFDREVTGRNRSELLRLFYKFPLTEGCVALASDGRIVACAAISSTSFPEEHLFKLGPVYCNTLHEFAAVVVPLAGYAKSHSCASISMYCVTGGASDLLIPHFSVFAPNEFSSRTFYSREYANPIDLSRCFVAHKHTCHHEV